MNEEIINRVANSELITIDLSDFAPKENVIAFDVKDFLFEGFILKERAFRQSLKEFDFTKYKGKIIALSCRSDAIIPTNDFS